MKIFYVNVYVNYPLDKMLTYFIDLDELKEDKNQNKKEIKDKKNYSFIFRRVIIDFNGEKKLGIIIEENIQPEKSIIPKIKKVIKIIDQFPIINYKQYEIAKWIKSNYFCTIEEALFIFIPKAIKKIDVNISSFIFNSNEDKKLNNFKNNIELTDEQKIVYEKIINSIENNIFNVFLIHGVTGSGKTEVYFKIIDFLKNKDFQTVLLIPEISLTPQMINFFYKRLGDVVAVIHSKLKPGEKLYFYEKIKNNEAKVIIGPRSVLFSPFNNLKAIIIDEEHDDSYKSNSKPRYNTRNLAYFIAKYYNGILIFGSATPSIESYFSAKRGHINLLSLTKRYNNIPLPEVEILDLKKENKIKDFYLTEKLVNSIIETLNKKEQVILFINRRGFSSIVFCKNCGKTIICENCSIPLTYHKKKNKLLCHYCNFEKEKLEICPYCNSKDLIYSGVGTEKVENIIYELFSNYKVERFDKDSVKSRDSYKNILENFSKKKIDILIGTQMISKGHHFPSVGLVGIINADTYLNFPDFRANEKTFQLLLQVSGRAGRGDNVGKVIIQTLRPDHYPIYNVKKHDYINFFNQEIKIRYSLRYPPFSRILRIITRSQNREKARKMIEKIGIFIFKMKDVIKLEKISEDNKYEKVEKKKFFDIIGPSPAPIEKIEKNFRFHIFIKSNDVEALKNIGNLICSNFKNLNDVFIEIDLDPVNML